MRYLVALISVLSFLNASGQQEAQFSQYYNNPYLFNPAAGGITNTAQFDLGFRRQWLGIEGTPQTFYATGHSRINFKSKKNALDEFNVDRESFYGSPKNSTGVNKHVVGGKMLFDQIGPFSKNSVMGSYAYHLRFTKKTMLSLGVGAGWSNLGLNSSKVILLEQDDTQYDEFLSRNSNQNFFDVNAGLSLYGENFSFGIASTQLLQNDLVIDQIVTESSYGRHWFMYGMYKFDLMTDFTLEPHFMFQTIRNTPFSLNLGSRIIYQDRYWFNLAYRLNDAINFGVGLNFGGNFRFGYAYDVAAGSVQNASNYVHELQIGFIIGNNRNVEKELKDDKKE
ncbi:MAG: type IX secretion system membrane protein PorP/SprF [Brumimicrobium sp.]|nr:type IX secretion system membrane protein PorP/SprF [Brumimicrobium sp.]